MNADLVRLQRQAVDVAGAGSFAELAALLIARRYQKVGRPKDARRILTSYLARHPATPAVVAALRPVGY